MYKHIIIYLLGISLLTSCSNIRPYKMSGQHNLSITSNTESSVKTAIDIYKVDNSCKLNYQGTVSIDKQNTSVSLPDGQKTYLVISFSSSSFWSSSSSSMSQETLLKPLKGNNYQLKLSYFDDIYNIELSSKKKNRKPVEIALKGLENCH